MAPNKKKKKGKVVATTATKNGGHSTTTTSTTATHNNHNNHNNNKQQQPRKLSIPELILAAEHAATTMMDLKNAITLYTMAIQKLFIVLSLSSSQDDETTRGKPHNTEDRPMTTTTPMMMNKVEEDNNETTTTTTTSMNHNNNYNNTITMILDVYEKRAELYIELQQTDLALQDYHEILRHLQQQQQQQQISDEIEPVEQQQQQQQHSPPMSTTNTSTSTTTTLRMEMKITNLVRQATVYMSMGQLSNSDPALQYYQNGKQCLHTALSIIGSSPSSNDPSVLNTTNTNQNENSVMITTSNPTAVVVGVAVPVQWQPIHDEIQHQYCRVCCCIAELYLTDLCYNENAEQLCEASLQESLSIINNNNNTNTNHTSHSNGNVHHTTNATTTNTNIHCIETYQMIASLRFSQKRNTEAHEYMKLVYEPISVGCQALAVLVGLRTPTDPDHHNSSSNNHMDHDTMAVELTALEHVQSLPPIEFRISTSKLLLECAGTLPYANSTMTSDDVDSDDVRDYIATEEQQEYAIKAMDVIGSCLAEQDEMYECWILLGDAMIFLEKESAHSYWNRALQILIPIQQQLRQELLENDVYDGKEISDENDDTDTDPIRQQLDTITMELDQLQERMDWAQRSGYDDDDDDDAMTNTVDEMEE